MLVFRLRTGLYCLAAFLARPSLAWAGGPNQSPTTPVITEPATNGQLVNFEDVHMETGPFSDPDAGQSHQCSDWEIWLLSPSERVWVAACVGGVLRTHIHLGDGVFQNSHAGLLSLLPDTDYVLRARHSDNSGDNATRWSAWALRTFVTSDAAQIFPLELDDVGAAPAPTLRKPDGTDYYLSPGSPAASIRVESPAGQLLLEVSGNDGASNVVTNPAALSAHVPVRVVVRGASTLPATDFPVLDLSFVDENGREVSIYLPAVNLPMGQSAYYWVSLSGASYFGSAGQTQPDFSSLARAAALPWRLLQPGYSIDVFATGFQLPVNIAFIPPAAQRDHGPLFYVSELYGTIKVVGHDGAVSDYAANLLNFNPSGAFPGSGELGLTGLVVDANGDVYAALLYSINPPNDGPLFPRVVRFTSNDGGMTAATQTTVLDMPNETMGASHQISNLSFGPDDKLYVHVGDGFNTGTAQNLGSFRGKVLRMNRNGAAPSDNPFYDAGNGITARDYVFAYGFRNPFGGAWRSSDLRHYEVENGPSVDRFAQVIAGRNYLWNGTDASMTNFAIYNWSPAAAPVNVTFIQASTFGGSEFPASAQDHAFVSESGPTWATGRQANGKRISEFVLSPAGTLVSGPTPFLEYIGDGKASCVALAAGPDGLYFSDFYKDTGFSSPIDRGANILRIRYEGRANFNANRTDGCEAPFAVGFSDASDVPGASARTWNFGDGHTSTQVDPIHVYEAEGTYDVSLEVTGDAGPVSLHRERFISVGPRLGVHAEYFNEMNLSGPPALEREDPNIFFDWGLGSPDPVIQPDTFSCRWTGLIVPTVTASYTFATRSDDGVRVFIDNVAIINNWTDHGPTFNFSAPIVLNAGQEYDLRAEHYENAGQAVMELYWSGPFAQQPVPTSALRAPTSCVLVGDADCNMAVTVSDIGAFVLALTDPAAYAAAFPGCDATHSDMNGDSQVTVGDIGEFVNRLTGG